MSYSHELGRPELPQLGNALRKVGTWALAGVLVAGGATVAAAYHDLKQGVEGPVFDIQHAETHALETTTGWEGDITATDPAHFDIQTHLFIDTIS